MKDEDSVDDDLFDESDSDDSLLACPSCGESVHEEAQQCPRCGDWITPVERVSPVRRTIWVALILIMIVIIGTAVFR